MRKSLVRIVRELRRDCFGADEESHVHRSVRLLRRHDRRAVDLRHADEHRHGIQAMMTKRIAQDGRFTVVERRKVNDVMREQDFAARIASSRAPARASARSRART